MPLTRSLPRRPLRRGTTLGEIACDAEDSSAQLVAIVHLVGEEQIGWSIGVPIFGAIFASRLVDAMSSRLPGRT